MEFTVAVQSGWWNRIGGVNLIGGGIPLTLKFPDRAWARGNSRFNPSYSRALLARFQIKPNITLYSRSFLLSGFYLPIPISPLEKTLQCWEETVHLFASFGPDIDSRALRNSRCQFWSGDIRVAPPGMNGGPRKYGTCSDALIRFLPSRPG